MADNTSALDGVGAAQPSAVAGVTFSPTPATTVYDARGIAQGLPQQESAIESALGVSLNLVSYCDSGFSGTSGCTSASGSGYGGTGGTFTSTPTFNYVTVHYGQQDLLFYFAGGVTSLTVGNLPNGGNGGGGLSNFRAYSLATVPLPAALPLLGTALAGLWGVRRRRDEMTAAA